MLLLKTIQYSNKLKLQFFNNLFCQYLLINHLDTEDALPEDVVEVDEYGIWRKKPESYFCEEPLETDDPTDRYGK